MNFAGWRKAAKLRIRRFQRMRPEDLAVLRTPIGRVRNFVITSDFNPDALGIDSPRLPDLVRTPVQLSLFEAAVTAGTGEI